MLRCKCEACSWWSFADRHPRRRFATLSLPSLPPPSDSFLPVAALPILDVEKHRAARGSLAVCLPPLTGDLYARGSFPAR